jgi:hypothetical protein
VEERQSHEGTDLQETKGKKDGRRMGGGKKEGRKRDKEREKELEKTKEENEETKKEKRKERTEQEEQQEQRRKRKSKLGVVRAKRNSAAAVRAPARAMAQWQEVVLRFEVCATGQ